MQGHDFTADDILELRLFFFQELRESYPKAREAHEAFLKDTADSSGVEDLYHFFHRIAGTAHTIRLPLLGYAASMAERVAEQIVEGDHPDPSQATQVFADALAGIATVLDDESSGTIGENAAPHPSKPGMEELARTDSLNQGRELSKVLVIDDDLLSARMITSCLQAAGYASSYCCDPGTALSAIEAELPDLIILDVVMPQIDGFELCRQVREHPALQFTPIIFVTRKGAVEERIRGLDVGGNDYIAKPFEPHELVARVRSQLKRLASLREMAVRDGLTRCFNHKYFRLRLAQEVGRAQRHGHDLTLAMIDVDKFKSVNDSYGHRAGDMVLVHLARLIVTGLRSTDVVARYGGEEFAVLMVQAKLEHATTVCNRLRETIASHRFPSKPEEEDADAARILVTVSIGIAELERQNEAAESLLKRADDALYSAKGGGRNCVVIADASS